MKDIIGNYEEEILNSLNLFEIFFFPDNLSIKWSQSYISAEFLSKYIQNIISPEEIKNSGFLDEKELVYSILYVTNELIENTFKFRSKGDIILKCGILEKKFILSLSNIVPFENIENFQKILTKITSMDPQELFLQQVEENALNPESKGSGLGFLTMMNDYNTSFGWKFERLSEEDVLVSIMAKINIEKENQ